MPRLGVLKSAAGIGGLLAMGIGDTIRVTLTADPVEEVRGGLISCGRWICAGTDPR
jgi:4-hydroxy-3-methylbut-2-en-1-yl diphosphate synthase IspG/GcpE